MRLRLLTIAPVLIALTIGFNYLAQPKMDAMRKQTFQEELLYLPNQNLLNHFTAGMSSVIADLLWIRTLQYTGTEFHNVDRKFTWLAHMCNTVTRLDPHFADAYAYGGMLLAAIGADDKALDLLRRGLVLNPDSPDIPMQMFQIYVLNRRERPESPALGAHYLRRAADLTEDPEDQEYYYELAHNLSLKHDMEAHARVIWENVLERNENELIRDLAREKLIDIAIRENLDRLAQAADAYEAELGERPAGLGVLVQSGMIEDLPRDDELGEFFIDPNGEVQNTILLEHRREQLQTYLNTGLNNFEAEKGRPPRSLEEWSDWAGEPIPPHPYADQSWTYNPETGEVR